MLVASFCFQIVVRLPVVPRLADALLRRVGLPVAAAVGKDGGHGVWRVLGLSAV